MAADSSTQIRVAVHGESGRMGRILIETLGSTEDVLFVASISRSRMRNHRVEGDVQDYPDIDSLLQDTSPNVVVDFSARDAVLHIAQVAARHGAHFVTGTSGIDTTELESLRVIAADANIGIMVGPNFSLGAAILERAASEAGRHFDVAEIIEMHHAGKADAPSGSAIATAQAMVRAREGRPFVNYSTQAVNIEHVRGGNLDNVAIHSVRMPGLMAHQQIMLGGTGETLTFRHDVLDRQSYMPGVLLAIREIRHNPGKLLYGLSALLWPE